MLTWSLGLGLEGQTEGLGSSFEADGGPMLECKDQAKDLAQRSEVRGQGSGLRGNERLGWGAPNPGKLPWALAGSRLSSSAHLQFASVQLQELGPVHLPRGELGSVLLQVQAVQPLAHLLAGPVVDSGEGFIQELG